MQSRSRRIWMRIGAVAVVGAIGVSLLVAGTREGVTMHTDQTALPSLNDIPASAWDALSQKRVYFGHRSVGFNIIDGIQDVMRQNPRIQLRIVETDDLRDISGPVFAHSKIGQNKHPNSKIESFATNMESGIGDKVDIAFLKFCYADVSADSDVTSVFGNYKAALARLKAKYPRTTFVHCTVPLRSMDMGKKARLKRVLGISVPADRDNIKRTQFNEMLRAEYQAKAPIFDVAAAEATAPDGKRVTLAKGGQTFAAMVPAYTYDGGHLSELGRRTLAEQLLVVLANVAE